MREYLNKHKWLLLVTSVVILLPMLVGLLLWDKLPEQVPFHWGINGEVDGWTVRPMAVFFMPVFMLAIHWFCVLATGLDPKRQNVVEGKMMAIMLWIIPVLNIVLHVMVYLTAMGREVNMDAWMPLFTGTLFVITGNYLPKCQQSHTMGIKLPWTLNDEENWNATHRLGGKIWVGGGLLIMLCALLPSIVAFSVMIGIMLLMVIVPTVYSYRLYKKKQKKGE